jgi:hypothetical protein
MHCASIAYSHFGFPIRKLPLPKALIRLHAIQVAEILRWTGMP